MTAVCQGAHRRRNLRLLREPNPRRRLKVGRRHRSQAKRQIRIIDALWNRSAHGTTAAAHHQEQPRRVPRRNRRRGQSDTGKINTGAAAGRIGVAGRKTTVSS